jgi:hypothetical protein
VLERAQEMMFVTLLLRFPRIEGELEMMSVMAIFEHMAHAKLVHRTFLHDEEGSVVVVVVATTGVGSNGVVLWKLN